MSKRIDLTGQRFGRVVVISYNEDTTKQKKGAHWNCICDCGNKTVVCRTNLRRGKTQSCGCLQKDKSSEHMKELINEKWKSKEFRQTQSEFQRGKMKHQWEDKEFRRMMFNKSSEQMKQQWNDEEIKWKMGFKGGITQITKYLRVQNEQWFGRCKQEANYTCQLTGKYGGQLHTHHLYAFSSIVLDAHNIYNIEVKSQVKDYTEDELKLLEEYVAEWHKDSSNAVVLSEEAHILFHKLYGRGGNTPEQYEEFKQRYINGEFKDLI